MVLDKNVYERKSNEYLYKNLFKEFIQIPARPSFISDPHRPGMLLGLCRVVMSSAIIFRGKWPEQRSVTHFLRLTTRADLRTLQCAGCTDWSTNGSKIDIVSS